MTGHTSFANQILPAVTIVKMTFVVIDIANIARRQPIRLLGWRQRLLNVEPGLLNQIPDYELMDNLLAVPIIIMVGE